MGISGNVEGRAVQSFILPLPSNSGRVWSFQESILQGTYWKRRNPGLRSKAESVFQQNPQKLLCMLKLAKAWPNTWGGLA